MPVILVFLLLLVGAADFAAAEVYRCRDDEGRLIMTDDPGKFPEGCRPVEGDRSEKGGSFIVIETPDVPDPAGRSVEQAVRDEQAKTSRREELSAAFKEEARELARTYHQALVKRNEAYNSWSYGSRQVVKNATETMEQAKKRKKELLKEIREAYLPGEVREEVRRLLDPIP